MANDTPQGNGIVGRIYNAELGSRVRYNVWPALGGAGTPGTKFTTGAGAWSAYSALVAAAAITVDFWLDALFFRAGGAAQVFEWQLATTAPVVLSGGFFDPTAVTVNIAMQSVGSKPIWMAANAEVDVRVGGAAAKDIFIGLRYATLL